MNIVEIFEVFLKLILNNLRKWIVYLIFGDRVKGLYRFIINSIVVYWIICNSMKYF